jgi:hypothetical protein
MFRLSRGCGEGIAVADDPGQRVPLILRRLYAKVDALALDMREVKQRLSTLEIGLANQAATEASHYASLALRLDRFEDRIGRIEKRLDLVEPA